jgi:hypothetical protein
MSRTNAEDDWAWRLWDIGWFLIGTAASYPFVRPIFALVVGIAAPFVTFWLFVAFVWSLIMLNSIF